MADESVEKKRKRRRSARVYLSNAHPLPTPEELAALVDQFPSDDDDDQPSRAKKGTAGDPAVRPGAMPAADARVSPPIMAGHASYSSGDHGAAFRDPMNVPGPRALALSHPDMQQSTTRPLPLFTRPTSADVFPADLRNPGSGVPIAVARLGAAGATGLASAPGNPVSRLGDHIARDSAAPPNGSHGLGNPVAAPPAAMKASDRLEVMRQTQRRVG